MKLPNKISNHLLTWRTGALIIFSALFAHPAIAISPPPPCKTRGLIEVERENSKAVTNALFASLAKEGWQCGLSNTGIVLCTRSQGTDPSDKATEKWQAQAICKLPTENGYRAYYYTFMEGSDIREHGAFDFHL